MSALDERWRKSTRSNNNGACVEVRLIDGRVDVRDTKLGEDSPVLGFTPTQWSAFITSVRDL